MKRRSTCRRICLLACAVMLLAFAGTALADVYTVPTYSNYYSTTAALNIRSGPGMQHPIIGTLSAGQVVMGLGTSDNWMQIVVNSTNITAYVSASYLSAYPYIDATTRVVYPVCSRPVYYYGYHNAPYVQGELFYYQPNYWNYYNNCYNYNNYNNCYYTTCR